MFRSWLDAWLYRGPFTGRTARRYARTYCPGFAGFHGALVDRLAPQIGRARTVLDIGAGPGILGAEIARAHPGMRVIAVEPSGDFGPPPHGVDWLRAAAEALPLAGGCADLAICVSSIRHVTDRKAALAELYRVLAPDGELYIVELDPWSSRRRIRNHVAGMRSLYARWVFEFAMTTAPDASAIAAVAMEVGWHVQGIDADLQQPVYIMRLTRARPRR